MQARSGSVAQVDDAAGEAAFFHEVEGSPRSLREGGEGGAADADLPLMLQRADGLRIEASLDPRLSRGCLRQRGGVDDLVRRRSRSLMKASTSSSGALHSKFPSGSEIP
jgi:hypothetical protein